MIPKDAQLVAQIRAVNPLNGSGEEEELAIFRAPITDAHFFRQGLSGLPVHEIEAPSLDHLFVAVIENAWRRGEDVATALVLSVFDLALDALPQEAIDLWRCAVDSHAISATEFGRRKSIYLLARARS